MTNTPETALIVHNEEIIGKDADPVAYSDWDELRKDAMSVNGTTAEELAELESKPDCKSLIFEAKLTQQEKDGKGIYKVKNWYQIGGRLKKIYWVYRIFWNSDKTRKQTEFLGEENIA